MLVFQKIVSSFIEFPGILIIILLLLLFFGRKKIGKWVKISLCIMCFGIYFFSTEFFVRLFVYPLEYSFKIPSATFDSRDLVVVLGGGVIRNVPIAGNENGEEPGIHTLKRLLKGFELASKNSLDIAVTGGVLADGTGRSEAEVMREILMLWGIPDNSIHVESLAKTTEENAKYIVDNIEGKYERIILVTSAIHLRRSFDTFIKQIDKSNIKTELIPYPCDYTIDGPGNEEWYHFLPSSGAFKALAQAFHEYLGMVLYAFRS